MTTKKTPVVHFAPGCFDTFEGTQAELDELIAEITASIASGEFMDSSKELDIDDLISRDPEMAEIVLKQLSSIDDVDRKLN